MADHARRDGLRHRDLLCRRGRRHERARTRARPDRPRGRRASRPFIRRGCSVVCARCARVPGPVRPAVQRRNHLYGGHVYRRAHHAHRPDDRRGRAGSRRVDRDLQRRRCTPHPLADRLHRACGRLLYPRLPRWLVRKQLHREAQRTCPRRPVHHPQHRDDAAGVWPGSNHAPAVPGRIRPRGHQRGGQPGNAREPPALGLARAAGHAAPDSGNPHLLRFSRYRHRPVQHRRDSAAGDARHPRAQHQQVAREQPQLDQREAHLHPRLRRDDEPGQRFHARRTADAPARQHARAEHAACPRRHTAGNLLWRAHERRRVRPDGAKGIQLPAGRDQQPDVIRRHGRHPGRRNPSPLAHRARAGRYRQASVQRRREGGQPPAHEAQRPRARRGPGAVPHLRSRSVHHHRRRRPAVVDDGRVHDLGELPVLPSLPARPGRR